MWIDRTDDVPECLHCGIPKVRAAPKRSPKQREVKTDHWYIPQNLSKVKWSPRWVLAIYRLKADGRERVAYSDGSDHYVCLRETFSKWIGVSAAAPAIPTEQQERPAVWLEQQQQEVA